MGILSYVAEPLISTAKTPCYWVLSQKRCIDSRNEIALSSLGCFMRIHKIMKGFSTPAAPIVETVVPNPKLKLLDQMSEVMRLKHYSIRTERTCCDWIRRYVKFHAMGSREQLQPAEPKLELFLSSLAAR